MILGMATARGSAPRPPGASPTPPGFLMTRSGTRRLRRCIFGSPPICLQVSGEASHVADPVELLVEGFRPSRSRHDDPSPEGAEHRVVEPQGRAEHAAAPATHIDLALGGIELELPEVALTHPTAADAMQHGDRGVVDNATPVLERAIDQLDLLASIELAAHDAALAVEAADLLEDLATERHVRAPHLRPAAHGIRKHAALGVVHDGEAIHEVAAGGEPRRGRRHLP